MFEVLNCYLYGNLAMVYLTHLSRRTSGAALVEYGLLVGLVAVVAIGAVSQLGGEIRGTFEEVAADLSSNISSAEASAPSGQNEPSGPPPFSSWEMTAEFSSYSGGIYYGVMSPGYGANTTFGAATPISGQGIAHLFTSATGNFMVMDLVGNVTTGPSEDAVLSCDNLGSVALSEASAPSYLMNDNITRWFWSGVPFAFTNGHTYSCSVSG